MWQCQQPSAAWPGFLGRGLYCAPYGGPVLGARGPCSPRSADGPVIIISRPVLPDHFLTPWTAVSLASLRRYMNSHFSSVLYFVHSINLYCDPALGSFHLCLTSGKSSPGGLRIFFSWSLPRLEKQLSGLFSRQWNIRVNVASFHSESPLSLLRLYCAAKYTTDILSLTTAPMIFTIFSADTET